MNNKDRQEMTALVRKCYISSLEFNIFRKKLKEADKEKATSTKELEEHLKELSDLELDNFLVRIEEKKETLCRSAAFTIITEVETREERFKYRHREIIEKLYQDGKRDVEDFFI